MEETGRSEGETRAMAGVGVHGGGWSGKLGPRRARRQVDDKESDGRDGRYGCEGRALRTRGRRRRSKETASAMVGESWSQRRGDPERGVTIWDSRGGAGGGEGVPSAGPRGSLMCGGER